AEEVDVARAADAGDLGAVGLGDLYGERPDPAGRAVDQYLLAGLQVTHVAQGGQCRDGGHGDGRALLVRNRLGFERGQLRPDRRVCGEAALAEEGVALVARGERGDIAASGLDRAGDVAAEGGELRAAHADAVGHDAGDARFAEKDVPVVRIDAGRPH